MSTTPLETRLILVQTTSDDRSVLQRLADQCVLERRVACAQLYGPVDSTYVWQGKICHSQEFVLLMKSTELQYAGLEELIRKSHNYEVPEIIATPVVQCDSAYRHWWTESVSKRT